MLVRYANKFVTYIFEQNKQINGGRVVKGLSGYAFTTSRILCIQLSELQVRAVFKAAPPFFSAIFSLPVRKYRELKLSP